MREKLGFLPAQSVAVGRTSQITGGVTFSESKSVVTISAASFAVAVNTLKSDRSMRNEKIHEIGLESNRYPTATFALSRPAHGLGERTLRQSHTPVGDRDLQHPWRRQERDPPGGTHPVGVDIRGRWLLQLPLERIRHDSTEHRWLRQRGPKSDDGIRPASAACLVVDP